MIELLQDAGHHRYEVFHPIAYRLHHEHGNWQSGKVLLELKVTVHREEHFELGGSESQELSILDACPSAALNCGHIVSN